MRLLSGLLCAGILTGLTACEDPGPITGGPCSYETSTVTGTLKTFVGAQVIASQRRSFRFRWSKRGLSLALAGFEQAVAEAEPARFGSDGQRVEPGDVVAAPEEQDQRADQVALAECHQDHRRIAVQMARPLPRTEAVAAERLVFERDEVGQVAFDGAADVELAGGHADSVAR